ncbi:DUF4214 domain-containing protein, partial [Sulfitobacter geojensis]|uniref:DUF4214 domain-containing protein n=1 Tax=Sulfitobacter geojensis TaxID=1342299 RepID=UPI003B8B5E12
MIDPILLTKLYIGYFGRAPEPIGLGFWTDVLEGGFPLVEIAEDFATQPEALALYPDLGLPEVADYEAFLTSVYNNLFGREPDAPGLAFWTAVLESGHSIGRVILDIVEGATGEDITTIEDKVALATTWTELAQTEPDFALTEEAIASSRNALSLIGPNGASDDDQPRNVVETFFNDPATLSVTQFVGEFSDEDDTSVRIKVADIAIDDDGLGINTPSLSGRDSGLFEIVGNEVFLRAGAELDGASNSILNISVQVDDTKIAGTPDSSTSLAFVVVDENPIPPVIDVPVTPAPPTNQAPTVALSNTVTTLAENADTTTRTKVADITVTDDALGTEALSLSG